MYKTVLAGLVLAFQISFAQQTIKLPELMRICNPRLSDEGFEIPV
jgi:hypothetical protein